MSLYVVSRWIKQTVKRTFVATSVIIVSASSLAVAAPLFFGQTAYATGDIDITNVAQLRDAIKNQADGQTWTVEAGDYGLTSFSDITTQGQTGWYFPVTANNITINGVGNPTIYGTGYSANGAWATQDLMAIFGNNVTINGLTLMPKVEPNKTIEVVGNDATIENTTITPNTLTDQTEYNNLSDPTEKDWGGSIYYNGAGGTQILDNVTINNGGVSYHAAAAGVNLVFTNVKLDYSTSADWINGYRYSDHFDNPAGSTLTGTPQVTYHVSTVLNNLDSVLASVKDGDTIDTTTSSAGPINLTGTTQTGQTVTANIPAGTTVTASGAGVWDGVINPPTITSVSLPPTPGFTTAVTSAIEIGSGSFSLNFDAAARLLFPGAANQLVGFIPVGGAFTPITTTCNGDTQSQANSQLLPAGGACYMNVGSDLVVWTTHFTQFVTYTKTVVTPAVQTTKSNTYVVQSGDTMSSIAQKFGLTLAQLESLNPQAGHPAGNFDLILPGDVLNVSSAVLLTSSAAASSNAVTPSSTGTSSVLGSNTGNGHALSTNTTKTTPAVASAVTASSSGKLLGLKWWWWVGILVVVAAILYYVYRLADANKHNS